MRHVESAPSAQTARAEHYFMPLNGPAMRLADLRNIFAGGGGTFERANLHLIALGHCIARF
jgi:hypothetical protein